MPGAEAHINVQSQDEDHVMMNYFSDVTAANSDDGLCLDSTLYKYTYEMAGIL
jgi:hypothetical protein